MLQGKHGKWAIHECQRYYTLGRETEREKLWADISPEFSSLTTGGNFARRTELRGLRSQKELLRVQHICKSVPLLKCLNRDFDVELAVLRALTCWYLQPLLTWDKPKSSPGFEHPRDVSRRFGVAASGVWSTKDSPSPSARHPASPQSYLGCGSPAQQSCLWTLSAVLRVSPFRTSAPAAGPSLPESLALTSGASRFRHINFPRYFIVAKLQRCVSEFLAFGVFCKLRPRCSSACRWCASPPRTGQLRAAGAGQAWTFIRNKIEGVGGQNKKIRLFSVPDAVVCTLFHGLFNNPGRSRPQFYILSTSQHLYRK